MRLSHGDFLEELYRTHFENLRIYAACTLNSADLSEELVQDTFHEASRHLEELAKHPNPGGWLRVTLKNKIAHFRRDRNRYIMRFVSLDTGNVYGDQIPSVEDCLPQQTESILRTVREVLTEEEWSLLRKISLEEQPYKTVAEELGTTVWACQKRVQRIREKLRQPLKDYF